ncbi:MAG: hypothetical protein ABSH49_11510 [Bryobacteraceae bacterium]|jgi:hypothetical protein
MRLEDSNFKWDVIAVLALLLVLIPIYWATLRPGQNWGGDFSQYIAHARNLALGRPYGETTYVVTIPGMTEYMPNRYPPVFPLLLAPVYRAYGLNFLPMKMLVQALLLAACICLYALARQRGMRPLPSAVAASAFALSGVVLGIKDSVISDPSYLFFAALALVLLTFVERRGWDSTHPLLAAALVLPPILLAYGSRSVGLSLALTVFVSEVVRQRRPRTFGVVTLLGFAAGVGLLALTLYDSRGYGNQFRVNLSAYWSNVKYYLHAPAYLWAGSPTLLRYFFAAITAVVVVGEWLRRLVTQCSIVEIYVPCALLPLLAHSTDAEGRLLLPILMLYFIYLFEGVEFLAAKWPAVSRVLPAAAVAVLAIGCLTNLRGMERGPFPQGPEQPTFTELCRYLSAHLDSHDLLVSWNPRVLALYTGRRSAWYPKTMDDGTLDDYFRRTATSYLLVYSGSPDDAIYLAPHIAREPQLFAPVYRNSDFVLYRIP